MRVCVCDCIYIYMLQSTLSIHLVSLAYPLHVEIFCSRRSSVGLQTLMGLLHPLQLPLCGINYLCLRFVPQSGLLVHVDWLASA